jgi:hypothetical protein
MLPKLKQAHHHQSIKYILRGDTFPKAYVAC